MSEILFFLQSAVCIIVGAYFLGRMLGKRAVKRRIQKESNVQLSRLRKLRSVMLTKPLSEKVRPRRFDDIVGQQIGIRALRAALCGENPQHVLIYGPPGVGKTCAARLVLDDARQKEASPFRHDARFIEVDATCVRFDERSIADPLIGSVHDPIYQGAGAFGMAGIPRPKAGAVTKAHGGVLFLDEIGELHGTHINRLLKVLEDRRVFFESAYYYRDDKSVPAYIHDIFQKGLPADFRLVGATTKSPRDIPAAIRSRCVEVFFRPLLSSEIRRIAINAAGITGTPLTESASALVAKYTDNGREAVNMVQMASGVAKENGGEAIFCRHIRWVVEAGRYNKRFQPQLGRHGRPGCVNGLAVYGAQLGIVIEIECVAIPSDHGEITITGLIDEEEMGAPHRRYRRKSAARGSVESVLTALRAQLHIDPASFDLHIHLPGSLPVDGPSAGLAIALAVYSAIHQRPLISNCVVSGEVSLSGDVRAVGGLLQKLAAARQAGAKTAVIPQANSADVSNFNGLDIIAVSNIGEAIRACFASENADSSANPPDTEVLSAQRADD